MAIKNVPEAAANNSGLITDPLHPWEKFGLTREQASERAMNAISRELGTLEASNHEGWNKIIALRMLQDGSDPAELWHTYQALVQADTRIMKSGENPYCFHPDDTPVQGPKAKTESPDLPS